MAPNLQPIQNQKQTVLCDKVGIINCKYMASHLILVLHSILTCTYLLARFDGSVIEGS